MSHRRPFSTAWTARGGAGLAALLLLTGCAGPGSPGARGAITEVHLFGVPVALNLDDKPGPDGIGVRVFVTTGTQARGVEMRSGRLEVLMFDGSVPPGMIAASTPLKVWVFEPRQLAAVSGTSALGVGYELALNWERNRPRGGSVTVVARYHPPAGPDLYSTANSISVGTR